jgi:CubicO group peptidase (beta-lactamase class C family)/D-alanyl-D-alanine dipeptidase
VTSRERVGAIAATAIAALLGPPALAAQARLGPRPDYAAAAVALEQLIAHERATKRIPAISIALVDDRDIVWATGFGWARPRDSVPATAETIYRTGSVSKMLTNLAVMHLVEEGTLDLDVPVTKYLPEFSPPTPDSTPITLRLLMTHHAGLVREPAIGSYFDTSGATLAATVASLNQTPLVYPPGTRFKYSNAGLAVIGAVIERVTGATFADYLRGAVLRPLGAEHSDFVRTPAIAARIAEAELWTVDGRRSAAPVFEFGMAPAINLYASANDLAHLLVALFDAAPPDSTVAGGGSDAHISSLVRRSTLEQMWAPQFTSPNARGGMGLGFFVGALDGRRRVGHDGAVYGFSTQVSALPDDRLGVVVTSTLEGSSATLERIAAYALRAMIAARAGQPPPPVPTTQPVGPGTAARLAGRYLGGPRNIELRRRGDTLWYIPAPGRMPLLLRARGDTLIVDDARDGGLRLLPLERGLRVANDTLQRVPIIRPDTAPLPLLPLLGEYGWDHNTMYVYEEGGRLFALLQWFFAYPLTAINDSTYEFPPLGLYPGEHVVFRGGRSGRVTGAVAGNVFFPRRQVGPGEGGQLRLRPQRAVPALLRAARRAVPPADSGATRTPDLVDLATLDTTLRFDIRYATTNNFLGSVFYGRARAFLQRPAAEALLRVHRRVGAQGFGLMIHDAYRPWYVTKAFWDATPLASRWLVADPARGSRHNRGCAVDLTLFDRATGRPVDMVATYDEATARSRPDYPGGTALQRWHREVLRTAMEAEGFTINSEEWWHFDYPAWRLYPIMNKGLEELSGALPGAQLR